MQCRCVCPNIAKSSQTGPQMFSNLVKEVSKLNLIPSVLQFKNPELIFDSVVHFLTGRGCRLLLLLLLVRTRHRDDSVFKYCPPFAAIFYSFETTELVEDRDRETKTEQHTPIMQHYNEGESVNKANDASRSKKKTSGTGETVLKGASGPELFAEEHPPSDRGDSWKQTNKSDKHKADHKHASKSASNAKRRGAGPELFPNTEASTTPRAVSSGGMQKKQNSGSKGKKNEKYDELSHASTVHHSNYRSGGMQHPQQSSVRSSRQALHGPGAYLVDEDRVDATDPVWSKTAHPAFGGASSVDALESNSCATPRLHSQPRLDSARNPSPDDYSVLPVVQVQRNGQAESKRTWGRRTWFAIGAAILIVIGAVVGITIGLKSGGGESNEAQNEIAPSTIAPTASPIVQTMVPSSSPTMTVGPTTTGSAWVQLGQDLDGIGGADEFGQYISMSGDGTTLAVAATQAGNRSAYIQLFRWQDNAQQWGQVGETILKGAEHPVALSYDGSRMIIGAVYPVDQTTDLLSTVDVFQLDNVTMNLTQLGSSLIGSTATFGDSVDISGDGSTIAIGDYNQVFTSDETRGKTGSVDTYQWDEEVAAWVQVGGTIFGEAEDDNISSVSLSFNGSVIAIGATNNDGSSVRGVNRGHARVFELDANLEWIQRGADLEPDPLFGKEFGWAVDLNDDGLVLAVGDRTFERINGAKNGAVSIFRFDGVHWGLQGDPIEGGFHDQLGNSLTLSTDGSMIVVGAPRIAFQLDIGYAIIFHWVRGSWVKLGQELKLGREGENDFGWAVGMSGDGRIVAVADTSIFDSETAETFGSVRIFELT